MKPAGWPRYMLSKRLRDGKTAYYWNPSTRDRAGGCLINAEPLGTEYGVAIARAKFLNDQLDAWRRGLSPPSTNSQKLTFGTLDWFVDTYLRSENFDALKTRTKPSYRKALFGLADVETREKNPRRLGELPIAFFTTQAIDLIYQRRLMGKKGPRVRQANKEMDVFRIAWRVAHRLYPTTVPAENPCKGMFRKKTSGTTVPATRDEVYALANSLRKAGHPHLGAAALICFEWHQRPEHVIAGRITWADYRLAERPGYVRILHPKTNEEVWLPLEDHGTVLFPEIEAYLGSLPRLGIPIVVTPGLKGPPRPYSLPYAQHTVKKVRTATRLARHLTLNSCRHGGMTELGDAELTEQAIMSLSGHRTADAARLYVKKTDKQRRAGAQRRRKWIETNK